MKLRSIRSLNGACAVALAIGLTAAKTPAQTLEAPPATAEPGAPAAPAPEVTPPPTPVAQPPGVQQTAYAPQPGYGYGQPPGGYGQPPNYGPPPAYGPPPGNFQQPYAPQPQPAYGQRAFYDSGPVRETTPLRSTNPGARKHDGFYLRLALGAGSQGVDATGKDGDVEMGSVSGSSVAAMTEIALGGTVGSGFVIGGGVYASNLVDGEMSVDVQSGSEGPSTEANVEMGPFGIVGPFVDWYVNPEGGLHLQAAAGFATTSFVEPYDDEDTVNLSGPGLMAGIGYEGWIGDQWSMGAVARVTYASMEGEDPSDSDEVYEADLLVPGVLLTVTYH